VRKLFILMSMGAAIWGIAYSGLANAQQPQPPQQPSASPQPMRPRIALVNIAKVLREFQKANSDGKIIVAKRQEYVDRMKPLREQLAEVSRKIQLTSVPADKERLTHEAKGLQRQSEDLEQEGLRVMDELREKVVVEVYQCVKSVINDIAVTNNLDLVMCYPDASDAKEEMKPAVAELKLKTPALIPFYHRGMDITEVVIVTLNKRHPAPPTTPAGAAAPMAPGVTPTGGTNAPRPR